MDPRTVRDLRNNPLIAHSFAQRWVPGAPPTMEPRAVPPGRAVLPPADRHDPQRPHQEPRLSLVDGGLKDLHSVLARAAQSYETLARSHDENFKALASNMALLRQIAKQTSRPAGEEILIELSSTTGARVTNAINRAYDQLLIQPLGGDGSASTAGGGPLVRVRYNSSTTAADPYDSLFAPGSVPASEIILTPNSRRHAVVFDFDPGPIGGLTRVMLRVRFARFPDRE